MSVKDAAGAADLHDAREFAYDRHDADVVALVDEIDHVDHRGIDIEPWEIVSTVTCAVQAAFRDHPTGELNESDVFDEVCEQMEQLYEPWFDPGAADDELDIADFGIQFDVIHSRYWKEDELVTEFRSISASDYAEIRNVVVPVVAFVLEQVRQHMAADRSAEREAGRNAIHRAVVEAVIERDLDPSDVEQGVARAKTDLHKSDVF
jgi:hypothetical protein